MSSYRRNNNINSLSRQNYLNIKKHKDILKQINIKNNINDYKRIYFLCGNARTFISCFDNIYIKIIDKLFTNNTKNNTHVLFYLKCDDPGPKGQKGWDFTYNLVDENKLKNKISEFTEKYKNITFYSEILPTNKISDKELLSQVKNRSLYRGFLNENSKLIRALHSHYNIEDCGKIIDKIESDNKLNFDFYIYIRPDLFFENSSLNISNYNIDKIILGNGPLRGSYDHLAIIPNKYKYEFFFARMNLIRINNKIILKTSEEIYLYTIIGKYELKNIGKYIIKRNE